MGQGEGNRRVKALICLAAMSLLGAAPAAITPPQGTPRVIAVPADQAARAKFPREMRHKGGDRAIDAIAMINRYVNGQMIYVADKAHYGQNDLWVMAPSDGRGDCEDFALTKMFMLHRAGVPIIGSMKIVAVLVHDGKDAEGHGILAVRLPHGEVAYLDNNYPEPMTRRELERAGYQFFDWRA
jgi:predicted transglutaminase-like cysteine proteinase